MRPLLLSAAALAAAACSAPPADRLVPENADIERLEASLDGHPCIGSLDGWERNYRFARKQGAFFWHSLNPDLDVIELHLRRAGSFTIQPMRNVLAPASSSDWPDSKGIPFIEGRYNMNDERLQLPKCKLPARR